MRRAGGARFPTPCRNQGRRLSISTRPQTGPILFAVLSEAHALNFAALRKSSAARAAHRG